MKNERRKKKDSEMNHCSSLFDLFINKCFCMNRYVFDYDDT
jgi:hypothetical protein